MIVYKTEHQASMFSDKVIEEETRCHGSRKAQFLELAIWRMSFFFLRYGYWVWCNHHDGQRFLIVVDTTMSLWDKQNKLISWNWKSKAKKTKQSSGRKGSPETLLINEIDKTTETKKKMHKICSLSFFFLYVETEFLFLPRHPTWRRAFQSNCATVFSILHRRVTLIAQFHD